MSDWKRTTVDEYNAPYKVDRLEGVSFKQISDALGPPHRYTDDDYPDDDYKTDACWCVRRGESVVSIWNYKNGHYEGMAVEDVDYWSVYHNDQQFFEEIRKEIV